MRLALCLLLACGTGPIIPEPCFFIEQTYTVSYSEDYGDCGYLEDYRITVTGVCNRELSRNEGPLCVVKEWVTFEPGGESKGVSQKDCYGDIGMGVDNACSSVYDTTWRRE